MKFKYTIKDNIMVITFDGNFIGEENGPEIIEVINNQINNGIKLCAVDVSKIKIIHSSGIGILITILIKFRNKSGEVILINPSNQVRKFLVITKLDTIFNIAEDMQQAINQLNNNLSIKKNNE